MTMAQDPWSLPTLLRSRTSEAASGSSASSAMKANAPMYVTQKRMKEEEMRPQVDMREPIMVLGGWDEPTMRADILAEIEVLKISGPLESRSQAREEEEWRTFIWRVGRNYGEW